MPILLFFGALAILGLLAAKRPDLFAYYFLAKSQRERLENNMSALSRTGWIIFGCSTFMVIALLSRLLPR